jgi:hypothetical protein
LSPIRAAVSVSLSCFLSVLLTAQQSTTTAQGTAQLTAQRDPQAIAILTQYLNATGAMAAISGIQDFTETGTITYNWAGQPVSGPLTIYGKGLSEFRMDASLSVGTQSFIANNNTGSSISPNGNKTLLSPHSVMTAGGLTLPATRVAAALNDPQTRGTYVGLVSWNDSPAYQVHVAPPVDTTLTSNGKLSGLGEFDLYIDQASSQLVELSETIWSGSDITQGYRHELFFSNYNTANGISVPFGISEKVAGQQTWSIQLTSAVFNSGLSDSLFDL